MLTVDIFRCDFMPDVAGLVTYVTYEGAQFDADPPVWVVAGTKYFAMFGKTKVKIMELERWETVTGGDGVVRVLPINDLRPHQHSAECWCHPNTDEFGVEVHNSLDGREHVENGTRRKQ